MAATLTAPPLGGQGPLPRPGSPSTDSLVTAARDAARADRNAEASELFARAIEGDPSRRGELAREWADQLTYSGRARRAVRLYREALRSAAAGDERRRALLGLGLALSWSGQLDEAEDTYRTAVAEFAGDVEGTRGLARVLVWRGRHRAAQPLLHGLLERDESDVESQLLLAQSQHWMGRTDRALATLEELRRRHPQHAASARFAEEVRLSLRPRSAVDYQRSTQSDDLDIDALSLTHAVTHRAMSAVELRVHELRYAPGDAGRPRVRVHKPGVHARHRFGDLAEVNAIVGADVLDPSAATGVDTAVRGASFLMYDGWLTLRPGDRVRIDVSVGRATFDNTTSLTRGITMTSAGVSSDFQPDERTRLTARLGGARISDGNRRWLAQGEAERELLQRPHLFVGARAERFTFDEQLQNGYFNPLRYDAVLATVRAWAGLRNRVWWSADASAGREWSSPGGARPRWSAGAKLSYAATRRLELETRYGYFSSRQLFQDVPDGGGFERGTAGVGARWRW